MKRVILALSSCTWLLSQTLSAQPIAHANTVGESAGDVYSQADERYGTSPVSARIDRLWKAIPGLNGWTLDGAASRAETAKAGDGKTHLVWRMVPPTTSLASLPPEPIYRGPNVERTVSLMVNVSWGEAYLPSMLNTLRREHVRATFFLDGAWVRKNPDMARRIVAEGHAIGSHGTGHPDFQKLSIGRIQSQMTQTGAIIRDTVGRAPVAFAPPSGAFDQRTVAMAHRYGLHTILWTVDTIDWRRPPQDVIVRRVERGVSPGALVLMHPTAPTAASLPGVIHVLKGKGYQFRTIDEVITERRPSPPAAIP